MCDFGMFDPHEMCKHVGFILIKCANGLVRDGVVMI